MNQDLSIAPNTLRWAAALLCILFSGGVALTNAAIAYQWYVQKRRASCIAFAGAIAGAIGLWILPVAGAHRWWWVPFVVDIAGGPWLLVMWAIYRVRKSRDGDTPDAK